MPQNLALVELPSSNKAEDVQRFIAALNQALDRAQGIEVATEWRGNRRYISLRRSPS